MAVISNSGLVVQWFLQVRIISILCLKSEPSGYSGAGSGPLGSGATRYLKVLTYDVIELGYVLPHIYLISCRSLHASSRLLSVTVISIGYEAVTHTFHDSAWKVCV